MNRRDKWNSVCNTVYHFLLVFSMMGISWYLDRELYLKDEAKNFYIFFATAYLAVLLRLGYLLEKLLGNEFFPFIN
jgi:hypothetical protein